eukprot:6607076-Prymnesium_polylepis.1
MICMWHTVKPRSPTCHAHREAAVAVPDEALVGSDDEGGGGGAGGSRGGGAGTSSYQLIRRRFPLVCSPFCHSSRDRHAE